MGRVLIFLAGLLLGAVGVYLLVLNNSLYVPGRVAAAGVAVAPAPTIEAVPPNGVQVPALPSEPMPSAPVAPAIAPAPLESGSDAPAQGNASESEAATGSEAAAAVTAANAANAEGRLLLPVQGVQAAQLVDTFTQSRGEGRLHDAIDIMSPRGTPVVAVADGRVAKLFTSKPGGLTVYQFDREEKLAYYYAHLDRYAANLAEGQQLKRGQVLGYVGSTGNASENAPHLHFAVMVLGPEKRWWKGTAVNPYPLLGGK